MPSTEIPPHTTSDSAQESLYAFVERHAAGASDRGLLALLLLAGATVALGIATGLEERWPLAALGGTLATIALWGLAAHAANDARPHRMLALAQWLLVALGTLLAVVAAYGLLFWVLGPRWML